MFALAVVESDDFLDLPHESQLAYFHLSMNADDDGVIDSPRKILRITGCSPDTIEPLIDSNFLIRFDDGTLVVTDWKRSNWIQKDRYRQTPRQDIAKRLKFDSISKRYVVETDADAPCIQNAPSLDTKSPNLYPQYSKEKNSIDKVNIVEDSIVKYNKVKNSIKEGYAPLPSEDQQESAAPVRDIVREKIPWIPPFVNGLIFNDDGKPQPKYWELSNGFPKVFIGRFNNEDDYYEDYAQNHEEETTKAIAEYERIFGTK